MPQQPGRYHVPLGRISAALYARAQGLQLRDTLTILMPGPRTLVAYLFREPVHDTVAWTALHYGLGVLDIDGCRIETSDVLRTSGGGGYKSITAENVRQGFRPRDYYEGSQGVGYVPHSKGRWPTNLLLVHAPSCNPGGTRDCASTCPVQLLEVANPEEKPSRFFPAFQDLESALSWLNRLTCTRVPR